MKHFFTLLFALCLFEAAGQSTFERVIYAPSDSGDMQLHDIIIEDSANASYLINTGYYRYDQDDTTAYDRAVLTKHDSSGNVLFKIDYRITKGAGSFLDSKSFSVVKTNDGYLMVGSVRNNANYGTEVPGGGDILLIHTNHNGGIIDDKRIDIGGDDVAYSIVRSYSSSSQFIICGSSYLNDTSHVFVASINDNLNVNWMTKMDLKNTAEQPAENELFDVVVEENAIWAVGEYKDNDTSNTDGLIVKLNGQGDLLNMYRVYQPDSLFFESFRAVEIDGDELIIAGDAKNFQSSTEYSRMLALKFKKATNVVTMAYRLGKPGVTDYATDIMKNETSTGSDYYVTGLTLNASTNSGLLYQLNSSFVPTEVQEYGGSDSSGIHALKIHDGATPYIGMCGYYNNNTPKTKGYVLKTDMNANSSCSDSIAMDTTYITMISKVLIDTVDTVFTRVNVRTFTDTLGDSLICENAGTRFAPAEILAGSVALNVRLYPNPAAEGQVVNLEYENEPDHALIEVYSVTGRKVYSNTVNWHEIQIDNWSSGMYMVHLTYENDGKIGKKSLKLLID